MELLYNLKISKIRNNYEFQGSCNQYQLIGIKILNMMMMTTNYNNSIVYVFRFYESIQMLKISIKSQSDQIILICSFFFFLLSFGFYVLI